MKKILVTIAIITLGITTISATANPGIDPKIISAFKKEFSFAKNAKWQTKEDLIQVSFLLNDQSVTAWYNADAELVTTARSILYAQLPISVIKILDRSYPNADFYGIIEVIHNNEVHYQLTTGMTKKAFVIKVTPTGVVYYKKKIK